MEGKIGLEEHFAVDETLNFSKQFMPADYWNKLKGRLLDFHEERIGLMDQYGIQMLIMSLNAPTIQAIPDVGRAIEVARIANDVLAEQVQKRPDRFQGFASLPMQDPDAAIEELNRCVKQLGFKGALVNGFSQVGEEDSAIFLDEERYWPFWEEVESLDVPFYLHPRDPIASRQQVYEGHPWFLGPSWSFGVETSIHALRLMASGIFDKHPRLNIILGHLGEGLPYSIWRVDHRIKKSPQGIPAKKPLGDYFRANFHITTAGNFRTQTLIDALLEVGGDHLLFSTDYPFEEISDAADWFDVTSISESDRVKIGRTNAIKLFKLGDV